MKSMSADLDNKIQHHAAKKTSQSFLFQNLCTALYASKK